MNRTSGMRTRQRLFPLEEPQTPVMFDIGELDQQAIRESNEVRSKHELAELVETTQNTADDERRRRTRSQLRYPHALLRENRAEQLSLERRLARLEQKKVDKAREIDAMKRTFTTRQMKKEEDWQKIDEMHMPVLFNVPLMSVDIKAADTAAASLLREDKTHPDLMDVSRHGTVYTTATDLHYGNHPTRTGLPPLKKNAATNRNLSERPPWMRASEEKTGFVPTEVHKLLRRYRVMYRGPQYSLIGSRQLVQMVRGPVVPAERLVHPTYSLVRGGTLVEADTRRLGGGADAADVLRVPDGSGTASIDYGTATSLATHMQKPESSIETRSATDATPAFLTETHSASQLTKTGPPAASTQNGLRPVESSTRRKSQWRLVKLPAKLRMRAETLRRHGEYTGKQYYTAPDLPRHETRFSQLVNALQDETAAEAGAVGGASATREARAAGDERRARGGE